MKYQQEDDESQNAVFNMALDTLYRLGKILQEIKYLEFKTEYSLEIRQAVKIGLVKQFFVQASPLLDEKKIDEYKSEILSLKPKVVNVVSSKSMNNSKALGSQMVYDEQLGIRLDEILIELQISLQKKKYFMPTSDDEGDF